MSCILNQKYKTLLPILLLILAMLSIQSGASLAKHLFPIIGAFGVTALRLFLATIILFIIFKPWRKKLHSQLRSKSLKHLLLYGISLGSMNSLFYLSLERIPLGIAVALEFTGPLSVAIFASRKIIDFIWIMMVIIGLFFLLSIGNSMNNLDFIGIIYAIFAGVCWGMYIVFGKLAGSGYGTATVPLGSFVSTLIFFPIGLYTVGIKPLFDLSILPIAFAVAILSTAFPYTLEMFALTRMPAKRFGTLMSLEPTIGAFIGMIFLNEQLTLTQWFALFCIIAASIGSTLKIQIKTDKIKN
ncbi:Threonine/homoserine exporter RhtA [Candidatus Arsenophonus lipoptenae]|uniref:Threonine/homoserine exporter RhtA n=1 Tax=Candidatus Arsenophonus lipoptenae TaxID=634113 RepID=A0A109Q7E4_9GAMM|nr:threonine/homoserine exporter RhtA [Candidatus Arsenophonus lipoptenae]AMA64859.1 Threonine/homoserine exporter RhtA [Candidatus Arsenophonus lipoptenae]